MLNKGPAVSPVIAAALISAVIGGIIGFYSRVAQEKDTGTTQSGAQGGTGKMGGGGGGGKMGGGGGKMGGGQPPTGTALLPRLVRNIDMIEKVQHKGLTPAQSQAVMPILKEIQSAGTLTDKDCDEKIAKIEAVLTDDQKQAIKDMTPQRGGGGGGMGKMGGGSGSTPYPGGPGAGGAGKMGGGGKANDANPFASERNKEPLTDLMTALQKK